jgi:hypothetical protein
LRELKPPFIKILRMVLAPSAKPVREHPMCHLGSAHRVFKVDSQAAGHLSRRSYRAIRALGAPKAPKAPGWEPSGAMGVTGAVEAIVPI